MKKLLLISSLLIAFGCGDKSNRSAETDEGNTDGRDQVVQPDSTSTMRDSTAVQDSTSIK
jgi:hypothetical protein